MNSEKETNETNETPEQPKRVRYSGIFDDDYGGDDMSLESALEASKQSLEPTQPTHYTVEIDGDEYDFEYEIETVRVINYEGNGGSQNLNDGSRSDSFTSGSRIVIEKSDDGTWKWYADGISEAGLLWESDDYDGFESADEAEQNARDYLETYDAE
jgi:hypothetical protein